MSVRKLFGAVSATALVIGGAASAQTLALTVDPADTIDVAEELDFADAMAPVMGDLPTVTVETTSPLPQANGFLLTFNLTGSATFGAVMADDLGGDPDFDSIVSMVTDNQAVFIINTTAATVDEIDATLPVIVSGCGTPVTLDVTFTDSNGTVIEGGSASLTDGGAPAMAVPNLVECVNAFQTSIASDALPAPMAPAVVGGGIGGADTLLELDTAFTTFVEQGADVAGTAEISVLDLFVNTMAVENDLLTPVALDDVEGLDFDVVFDDLTGLGAVELLPGFAAGTTVGTVAAGSTTAVFQLGTPVAQGNSILTLDTAAMAAPIAPQQPTVIDAELDLGDIFIDEPVLVVGAGADGLELEGANFGPFDWVPDSSFTPITVFRITGLDPADVPDVVVTISNSSVDNNGTFPIDISGLVSPGGQVVLTNQSIETLASTGAYGIGDITITFFENNPALDVDRLLSTEGVVSAFGDDGNLDINGVIFGPGGRQTEVSD